MKSLLKINVILLMLIATFSCTKNEIIINGVDDPSTLKIQLVAPTISTRAIGYGDNSYKEGRIKTATIGVFHEDGSLNIIKGISFNEGIPTEAVVSLMPGDSQTVWVISNVESTQFDNVTVKEDFEKVLIDLTQSSDNISMSGSVTMDIPAGKDLATTLGLKRLPFKVSISSIVKNLTKGGYPNATLIIKEVMLFDVNSKSTVTNVASDRVSGVDVTDLRNSKEEGFGSHDRHFFYGMPGSTRIIVRGLFKDGDRETDVYYPIDIDAVNNTHYDLKLTITGPGVTNPKDDYDPVKLDLKLQVVAWDYLESEHEF